MNKWTRRAVLATGGLVGGGLVLGVAGVAFAPNRLGANNPRDGEAPRVTTWIRIAPDNAITVLVPHCEMGQGVHTALAMMLAEEMEADWSLVRVEEAPGEDEFANGYLARVFVPRLAHVPPLLERSVDYSTFKLMQFNDVQVTGGSSSVRATGFYGMRVAGAAAKVMLTEAAAERWQVPPEECAAHLSRIVHAGSNRSATFGELAQEAAKFTPPLRPPFKPRDRYSIVGKPVARTDIPSKVDGSAIYGIDAALPGMLYATVAAAPVFGAKLGAFETAAAEAMPGVKKVVRLENAIAVVADGYWRALQALRSLVPTFTDVGKSKESSETLFAAMGKALETDEAQTVLAVGDAVNALGRAAKAIDAEYRVPFLAHATMEPMSALARVDKDRCEVWTGVQDPLHARKIAAEAAGLGAADVTLHNQPLGGGFGRRLPGAQDFVDQAVRIAKVMSPAPVKLIWSREEDIQHDFYRPAVLGRFKGAIASSGAPTLWISRFNGPGGNAARIPYVIANQDIRCVAHATHVRLGAWRSVEHSQHGFFSESFIDELAHAAGKDPYEYRRDLLRQSLRHRAVLEKAAKLADWGAPLAPGRGRGIALVESFDTIVAEVAEVEVTGNAIRVRRVCAAVDCGNVINPDTAAAQIEGGILFGLSAALFNEITLREGRVVQSNFSDYPMAKLADAPRITVEFIESGAALGGLGEPGVPPIAPAIANAVFAATGKRLRTLPLRMTAN